MSQTSAMNVRIAMTAELLICDFIFRVLGELRKFAYFMSEAVQHALCI